MKDLLFWGLDEARLDCDPRYLVAWLEAQGLAWWADDLWHLTFDGVDALEEARPRAERARAARLATKPRRRRGKPSCVDREALEAAMRADGVYLNARLVARALPLPPAARQVTYAELADETGLSRWQVRAAVEELKVARWLRVRVQICPATGQKPNVMQLVERKASDSAGAVAA